VQGGVSSTVVKRTVSYFEGICVVLGCLREFHSWLMLDDVKDLVNRQLQGVKDEASSAFTVVGEEFSFKLERNVPFTSYQLEGSPGAHAERLFWSAFCLV